MTHAKKLQGNLLIMHGTGDDNVHYQNFEMLVNELIKHNKQFSVMSYPMRDHGINQGVNTTLHVNNGTVLEKEPVDLLVTLVKKF